MIAPGELRKKAKRCHQLAEGLSRVEDAIALNVLAVQLEQQADAAEMQPPAAPAGKV
jgi:hypothetical protein